MATEENDKWGRGLTFPNTSVHRLLSITPIAAVPFVRTSKAYEKIERRSPILRGGNLHHASECFLTTQLTGGCGDGLVRRSGCLKAENALPAAENGVQTISK